MANGIAYGFINASDLFSQRVIDAGVETVFTMVEESLRLYVRQFDSFSSLMVSQTTKHQERYALPSAAMTQPIDADSSPKPLVYTGVYDVAYPLRMFGTAWGTNRVSRAKMTIGDANRYTMEAMRADYRREEQRRLAALFTNVSYTYTDEEYGALTVQPLANGDAVTYVQGNGSTATAQHYLAQASAIDNSNDPYPVLFNVLDAPSSNVGEKYAFIPTGLVATTRALADFIPAQDRNVQYGVGITVAVPEITTDDPVMNSSMVAFGDRLLGYHEAGVWIVEKRSLPAGYIVSMVNGADPVLAERIEPEPELQGFFPEYHTVDGNHEITSLIRRNGYGVRNRVGAAITRIGNGTYAIPSGYDARIATGS